MDEGGGSYIGALCDGGWLTQTGRSSFRRLLPNPLAACFRVLIRISVHRIGRMDGPKGIVHHFVRLILGDTGKCAE